ncbi:hypothetical protein [uncultured Halomonas sp.]|uniref:hypothetical protein n=1 Tax=uncultured Halomonas sp. TaxID=173971 RepID=UPI0026065663|nr:hypothetical protein [uncultured Halomonas sp.]
MTVSKAYLETHQRTLLSIALKLAVLSICIVGVYKSPLADTSNDIYGSASALATSSATLLGFVIAASAAIITVIDKPFLSNLRKTGHINHLWDTITQSAIWIGLSFILSLLSFFLPEKAAIISIGGSFGCIIVGFVSFGDASRKLLKIFQRL